MITNAAALAALTSKPKSDEITLKLLQDFYDDYLKPYRFTYELGDGFVFRLDFQEKAFCHIVGVENVIKGSVSAKEQEKYRGDRGYQGIKNGTIDFKTLKDIGGKLKFNDSKIKFVHFYLLPQILAAPNQCVYYKVVVNRIQCDLLIFDVMENAYIHLGIEKGDNGLYVPRTFLIEKITATSTGTKFIDPQPGEPIAVVKTTRTVRNSTTAATPVPNPVTAETPAAATPAVTVPATNQPNTPQSSDPSSSTPSKTGP